MQSTIVLSHVGQRLDVPPWFVLTFFVLIASRTQMFAFVFEAALFAFA